MSEGDDDDDDAEEGRKVDKGYIRFASVRRIILFRLWPETRVHLLVAQSAK